MLKLDLGCGDNKQRGFIGVDRHPLSGVDAIADMNSGLPFRDNSVDLLVASHSLEHVRSLLATMQEVFRICKHGAQLCVVAPYSDQKLNLANPYHTCVFNEHTPRFWTPFPSTPVDPIEYLHPHAAQWGLSLSDHSDPGIDIRLVRMEFFYFPEFAGLPAAEQRRLRLERMDVCDQILYHLIVWKPGEGSATRSFEECAANFEPYEPEYIPVRRKRDQEMASAPAPGRHVWTGSESEPGLRPQLREGLSANLAAQRELLQAIRDDRQRATLRDADAAIQEAKQEAVRLAEAYSRATKDRDQAIAMQEVFRTEFVALRKAFSELQANESLLIRELAALREFQTQQAKAVEQSRQELVEASAKKAEVAALTAKLGLTQVELETTSALVSLQRRKEEALAAELAGAKKDAAATLEELTHWRALWAGARSSLGALCAEAGGSPRRDLVSAAGFVFSRERAADPVGERFSPLREYSDRNLGTARASLVLGCDLTAVPYREYSIPFPVARLSSVSLGIRPLIPGLPGVAGIEVVSAAGEILAQTILPLAAIQHDRISEFRLSTPLLDLQPNWWLRVFAKDTAAPVALYELAKGRLLRGPTQYFPLLSLR